MAFDGYSYNEIKTLLTKKGVDFSCGENINPHTVKKINYVKRYVEQWLYVIVNVSKYIFFIDAMSNSGLYENGHLSTSIEVLNVFIRFAKRHPDKQFFLISNDYEPLKVGTMNEIFKLYDLKLKNEGISNIQLEMYDQDACEFLTNIRKSYHFEYIKGVNKSVLVYVDPYNFIAENLVYAVKSFIKVVYCELLLNFYYNDYIRNVNNPRCKKHQTEIRELIRNFCGFEEKEHPIEPEKLRNCFAERMMANTKMEYSYSVNMKNEKNVPLYYLIYLTPNIQGLRKVKDATWEIIGHHDEYCVSRKERDGDELNLFNETPADEAFVIALDKISPMILDVVGKEKSFCEIEVICLENTFMKESHILDRVIKPFIRQGKLEKAGYVRCSNFKEDKYIVLKKDK